MNNIASPVNNRLLCIDVFRGITIFFMIVVNNPGSYRYIYWPLEHAAWNGLTPTDLVFPFFLFISGASIYFALSKKKEAGLEIGTLLMTILRRGIVIILIGILVHSLPGLYELKHFSWVNFFKYMRFPGVLQRIGLVYIVVSLLYLKVSAKTLNIIAFALLTAYYLMMAFVPVPGVGIPTYDPAMNLESWIDRIVLGSNHLYGSTYFWDPEGLLSTIPAISTGIFGLLAGQVLKSGVENATKLKYLIKNGTLYLIFGLLVSYFLFPSNKNLWSSSFVLITAGLACFLLATFFFVIDVRKSTFWTKPFVYYGVNSILIYIIVESMSTIFSYIQLPVTNMGRIKTMDPFSWIYQFIFLPLFSSPYFSSMVWALVYASLYFPLLWFFYRKKIFLKI